MIHRANPALRETDRVLADPRPPEPGAGEARARLRPGSRAARAREGAGRRLHRAGQRAPARPPPSAAPTSRRASAPAALPARADAADGGPRRLRREATPVARDLNRVGRGREPADPGARAVLDRARPSLTSLGDALEVGPAGAAAHAPADPGPRRASPTEARPLSKDLDELTASFDKTGGIERADGLHLLLDDRDQRVRRGRPLPARGAEREPLHAYASSRPPAATPTSPTPRRRLGGVEEARHHRAGSRRSPPRRRDSEGQRAAAGEVLGGILGTGGRDVGGRAPQREARSAARPRALARAAGHRRADARLPAGETTDDPPARAASLAGSPVLVGAVTLLVVDRRGLPLLQRQRRAAVRARPTT